MKIKGILKMNEEGQLCINAQISPQNPELYDIPLIELLQEEDLIGKNVKIEILPVKKELLLE